VGARRKRGFSVGPRHRLAQVMGHDSLDTTMVYVRGTQGLQRAAEERAWA